MTLDPNYHPHNWPDTPEFVNDLKTACMYVDVIKPSLDDCVRLFGSGSSPAEYASSFLDWGPSEVIITMGGEGVLLASSSGPSYHITPNKVTVAMSLERVMPSGPGTCIPGWRDHLLWRLSVLGR